MKKLRPILSIAPALVAIALATPHLEAQLVEDEEVLPLGSNWDYLLYAIDNGGGVFTPVNPATIDPDFDATWQLGGAGYDGPAFQAGGALLGYGTIDGDPVVTDIWGARDGNAAPPTGSRRTAYFRTTFTPTANATGLRISGIVDDGAVVYLDGVELTRTANMSADPDTWVLLATATGSETTPVTGDFTVLSLPAGVPVTVAVSLHQATTGSSDIGMNLRIATLLGEPASAPPNDNFADAEVIVEPLPVTTAGRTHDNNTSFGAVHALGATMEEFEPSHAGLAGTGSVWYRFTPSVDGRVFVSTDGSNFATLLAVYTGGDLDELVEVGSSTDDVPFYAGARVVFDAVAGTTYSIAVDEADNGGAPVEGENFGDVTLTVGEQPASILAEIETLLPARSDWYYLLAAEDDALDPLLTNQPVDPALFGAGDPDFHTTWHTEAGYDGPAFLGPSPAPLGYGLIAADPIATDIWGARDTDGDPQTEDLEPPTGQRYATYFWMTFTPTSAVPHLGFRGLVDDGAAIFINGVQVATINFDGDAADWQAFAGGTAGTEVAPQETVALNVNLPAGVPVEIGVTVRSGNATSSDIGFDLEVYSIRSQNLAASGPLKVTFDGGATDNLLWSARFGSVQAEALAPNPPAAPANMLFANNGQVDFTSGLVDLGGVDNATVVASVDFRSFEDSDDSDFEDVDAIEAYIEGTTDGFSFSRVATILPLTAGGSPDQLKPFELADGAYTTFSSAFGSIPDGVQAIRVVIEAVNNSNSERFFFDNICIGIGAPPLVATITHNRATGENRIDWDSDGVSFYQIRFSGDLRNWVEVGSGVGLSTLNHTPPAGTPQGFYQVRPLDD